MIQKVSKRGRNRRYKIPLALRAEKPESLIGYMEETRGRTRSEEMCLPKSERENVEKRRGWEGGDARARVWETESLRAAENDAAAGDDTAERLPVILNMFGLNEFQACEREVTTT